MTDLYETNGMRCNMCKRIMWMPWSKEEHICIECAIKLGYVDYGDVE